MEKTLAIIKPDAVQRRLIGQIVSRIERKGLQIAGMKMLKISEQQARKMYQAHEGKDFYEPLVRFMLSFPVVVMVVEGKDACKVVRKLMGSTFGPEAEAGTIRGDFGVSKRFNLVHGSDSPEAADFELSVFFDGDDLIDYQMHDRCLTYDLSDGTVV